MEKTINPPMEVASATVVLTPENLLEHWQGHRRLTRRVIEAFPEDKLFDYSVGGMRPFAELATEMLHMALPGVQGVATRQWKKLEGGAAPKTREELLRLWDETTEQLNAIWPQIPAERFQESDKAFGQWDGPVWWVIFYFIDNEIHHRGQGTVYLRSLGIEPPHFWER